MADRHSPGFSRRRSRSGRTLGTVAGVFLLPATAGLLVANENRMADMELALAEGAAAVREAPSDRIDPSLEGRLVHVAGPLSVLGPPLTDPDFPAVQGPPGTIQLRRTMQAYQWQERSSRGGSYSYAQVWSDQVIDSTRFHQPGGPPNPPPRYRAQQLTASDVRLGPYRLTETLLGKINGEETLVLAGHADLDRPGMRMHGNALYLGRSPDAPQIGDQQIAWQVVRPAAASVIAQQRGAGFVPYKAGSGGGIHLISPGLLTAGEMIGGAEQDNVSATWVWRVASAGLMFLAFFLLLRSLLPDEDAGGGHAPGLLSWAVRAGPAPSAAVLTVVSAPACVTAAWLVAHPAAGLGVPAAGLTLAWLLTRRAQRQRRPGRRP